MSRKFFNKLLCSNFRLYYRTHELNDILYLHFKGFRKIENLSTFINLKVLYLEGNSIKKIEGLNHLKQLTSLYLHENCIEKIENLEGLDNLYNLNLSDNCIYKIENLSSLKNLSNLLLKRNRIGTNDCEDLSGLLELPEKLTVLDISENRIEVVDIVKDYLTKIKNLRVLYLQGNDCIRKVSNYRKTLINSLKELHYLDDKPVFDDERRFSEAFGRGGLDEEKRERALFKKEKEEYEINRLKEFQQLIDRWKNEKEGENNGNKNEEEEKENPQNVVIVDEEQKIKDREEAKKKLLMKCKQKQIQQKSASTDFNSPDSDKIGEAEKGKILSISEEIIDENVIENDEKSKDKKIDVQAQNTNKKVAEKPSNDIFDDLDDDCMPSLEAIKFKKQEGYIDYIIEKNTYEEENEILEEYQNNKNISTKKEIEEEVDTDLKNLKEENIEDSNNLKKEENPINNERENKNNKVAEFEELD